MGVSLQSLLKAWCQEQNVTYFNHGFSRDKSAGYVDAILLRPKIENKGLIVFAHGTGNDLLYSQISLFKAILSAGYAVFTFDLDGHGVYSSTTFDPGAICSCLRRSVEIATSAAPDLKIHLVGHSLGGALTMDYLANSPVSIESATLISVPLYIPQAIGPLIGEFASIKSKSIYQQISHYGLWKLLPAFGRFKRHAYPIRLARTRKPSSAALSYIGEVTKAFEGMDLVNAAANVDVPTLLIYGTSDKIAPLQHGEKLFESLAHCELYVIPNETHFTTILSRECETKVISWLNKY